MELPPCPRCKKHVLIPLSDYGQEGSSVQYKAWVCIDVSCRCEIRIDKGKVSYGLVEVNGKSLR